MEPAARLPERRIGPTARWAVLLAALALAASLLVGCSSDSGGVPTLNLYIYPDNSGSVQQAVDNCTAAAGGKYRISYQKLPNGADGQRQQMVRRLAAKDSSMDILGLDVTWAPEFAEAGWILEWTGDNKAQVEQGTLPGPLATATYKDKLWAAPFNSNTQLLWYRSDLVPTPPKTWAEMQKMANDLAAQGKPHYIEIQGNQYEGITVWFNTLLASGGGSVLNADGTAPSLGPPAVNALTIMHTLATSPAADPSLSVQQENDNRLAMESGTAAFELNYPFVYPSMKANKPDVFKDFKWAPYPAVSADQPAHVTIGGINLAIGAYSKHPDLAFEATLCLRNRDNQLIGAVTGGVPPSLAELYDDPALQKDYPFAAEIKASLASAATRPLTPAYQNISIVISHAVSPPASINPESTEKTIASQIEDALDSKGLVP
jgi:ABC-type glycerol-3-phosphate transport system substrate-binding protein